MRFKLFAPALLIAAVAACGGGDDDAIRFDENPTEIAIEVTAGDIVIESSTSGTGVEIVAEASDDNEVSAAIEGGVLTISDDCDSECSVDYTITVAGGDTDVTVVSALGSVRLIDMAGVVDIDAAEGDVTLQTVTGDLTVAATDGDVLGTRLTAANVTIEVGSGDIDVTFDEPVAALLAATGSGDITAQLDAAEAYAVTTDSPGEPDIQIDVDDTAGNTIDLRTADGEITVYKR